MFSHSCIKCKRKYESKEEDAYLCEACNEARLALAREIDAKVGSTVGQKPASDYQKFYKSSEGQKGIKFVNIKDLS